MSFISESLKSTLGKAFSNCTSEPLLKEFNSLNVVSQKLKTLSVTSTNSADNLSGRIFEVSKSSVAVQLWEEEIVKLPVPSNLAETTISNLLYAKTKGRIGLLDRVLRMAAILSLKQGNKKIDRQTLDAVLERYE